MQIKYGYHGVDISNDEVSTMCGEGWRSIISQLIIDLFDLGWDGALLQIKEKWGELRFYIGTGSDAVYDRIDEAERLSRETCIVCGAKGQVVCEYGWYQPLCEKHIKHESEECNL